MSVKLTGASDAAARDSLGSVYLIKFSYLAFSHPSAVSTMVSMTAFQAVDMGSIPVRRKPFGIQLALFDASCCMRPSLHPLCTST